MKLKGRQVAAARELLGLSQTDLAAVTGVARSTISRFEAGEGDLKPSTLAEIQAELERRGIEFSNGTGTGVRLDHAKAEEFARQSGQTQKEADR